MKSRVGRVSFANCAAPTAFVTGTNRHLSHENAHRNTNLLEPHIIFESSVARVRIALGMRNSPFAKLSKELRDIIYQYALPDPLEISTGHARQKVNITQLCRQMREEALRTRTPLYKLSIAYPTDTCGFHICYIKSFYFLLEEAVEAFQQLPVLFHSKPTTIHLHVSLGTELKTFNSGANGIRLCHNYPGYVRWDIEWWDIRRTVRQLMRLTHPHKLILALSCKYTTVPHHLIAPDAGVEDPRIVQVARALDTLYVEVALAGDCRTAKDALSKAVAKHNEAINMHVSANHAIETIGAKRDWMRRDLGLTHETMDFFMESLFKDKRGIPR